VSRRRHEEPVNVDLAGFLGPAKRSHERRADKSPQPQQGDLAQVIKVFVQWRDPIILDQGRLDGIGRVLDLEQRPGELVVGE